MMHNEFQKVYEKFIEVDCLQATNFLATVSPKHFAMLTSPDADKIYTLQ